MDSDGIKPSNIKRHVGLLQSKLLKNQQERLENPDDPERWIQSEVDLEEQIRFFQDLSTKPDLYESFEENGGLRLLCETLSHPNIDIAITTLNVLNDLLDPEIIVALKAAKQFLNTLHSLELHKLCITILLKIDEDNGEVDYEGVKSTLGLLEALMELFPPLVEEIGTHLELLLFMLKRMKTSKTLEYDNNRVHAGEILCILLQQSEECLKLVGSSKVGGIDKLLRIIAIYRKKDPEGIEEEEVVENAFQCLCNLMLVESNRVAFAKLQGIKVLIRLIKERRYTYKLALKLLDFSLMDCPTSCNMFVEGMGLKSIFSVLMRKGVKTKQGSEDEKTEDEHTTGTSLARVINKFVEHKYEKLERIVELHERYTALSEAATKRMESKATSSKSMYSDLDLNQATEEYLDRYDAGLSICQHIDNILIRLYNMGNSNLSTCLLFLLHNKGVNIQHIYNNIAEYLDHMDESARDTRDHIDKLLKNFLTGASDSGLFT